MRTGGQLQLGLPWWRWLGPWQEQSMKLANLEKAYELAPEFKGKMKAMPDVAGCWLDVIFGWHEMTKMDWTGKVWISRIGELLSVRGRFWWIPVDQRFALEPSRHAPSWHDVNINFVHWTICVRMYIYIYLYIMYDIHIYTYSYVLIWLDGNWCPHFTLAPSLRRSTIPRRIWRLDRRPRAQGFWTLGLAADISCQFCPMSHCAGLQVGDWLRAEGVELGGTVESKDATTAHFGIW